MNDGIQIIGFSAAFFTTIAYLPQAIKVHRTKKTRDISLLWIVTITMGITLWLLYGYFINDYPIIVANTVSIVLTLYLLVMKLRLG